MKKLLTLVLSIFVLTGCCDKLIERTRGYIEADIDSQWEVLVIHRSMDTDRYKRVWVEMVNKRNKKSLETVCGHFWYKDGELYVKDLSSDKWIKD